MLFMKVLVAARVVWEARRIHETAVCQMEEVGISMALHRRRWYTNDGNSTWER